MNLNQKTEDAASALARSEPDLQSGQRCENNQGSTRLRPDGDNPTDRCDRGRGLVTVDALQNASEEGVRNGQSPNTPVPHYRLQANDVLPFLKAAESGWDVEGGFSTVHRVTIHPHHRHFDDRAPSMSTAIAVKQLHSKRKEDFEREVGVLEKLASLRHDHIVKLLATYQHRDSNYLLFPWATHGNLRSFWNETRDPDSREDSAPWMMEQLHGIASALMNIHRFGGQCGEKQDVEVYGRHGDIKPENILVFRDQKTGRRTLQLADFGLAEFHRVGSQPTDGHVGNKTRNPAGDPSEPSDFKPRGYSPTYRSPEIDFKQAISSKYDIWSLGCVYLEFAIWWMEGVHAVREFAIDRTTVVPSKGGSRRVDDGFFELHASTAEEKPHAKLKSSVSKWIDDLRTGSNTTTFLNDYLDLVENEMLVVDPKKRATSPTVANKLNDLKTKCQNNSEYTKPTSTPTPRNLGMSRNIGNCNNSNIVPHYSHTISVNMARLPDYHTEPYTTSAATLPTTATAMTWSQNSFGDRSTPNLFQPYVLEQPDLAPTGRSGLHQNMHTPAEQFHRASGSQSTENAPAFKKRKIERFLEHTGSDETNKAKTQRSVGSGRSGLPQGRRLERGPPSRQLEESEAPTRLPAKNMKPDELFACPYYKRNPAKYGTKAWKSCIGPGWTIHRLKGHLYRRHCSNAFRCNRCFAEFGTSNEHCGHLRSEIPCFKRTEVEGSDKFDESQKTQIQRKMSGKPNLEKWTDIYRIIFPFDPPDAIPSPYWEDKDPGTNQAGGNRHHTTHAGASLADFEGYLKDRRRDEEIDPGMLSELAICHKWIQAFNQSSNTSTQLTNTFEAPSLTQSSLTTTTTQSSLTTSTSYALDPPFETLGNSSANPEKPASDDWMSFLDDPALDDAVGGVWTDFSDTQWRCEDC